MILMAVAIQTSLSTLCSAGVFGSAGVLKFDFLNGGLPVTDEFNNSILVSPITGQLAPVISTFTLQDVDTPNTTFGLTYGSTIDFDFTILSNFANLGGFADSFSLVLLDGSSNSILQTTNVNALFQVDIDGVNTPIPDVFTIDPLGPNQDITWSVTQNVNGSYRVSIFTGNDPGNGTIPEPTSLAIWSLAGLGLLLGRRRR